MLCPLLQRFTKVTIQLLAAILFSMKEEESRNTVAAKKVLNSTDFDPIDDNLMSIKDQARSCDRESD
jgi:hypothetical protein